jgi:hypothetical protein
MEKIKKIVNFPLFKAGVCAAVGLGLAIESHLMYAGIAFGYGIREFFLAFKENQK